MPQLDFATYFNQILYLFIVFFIFYIIVFDSIRKVSKIFFLRFLNFSKKKEYLNSLIKKDFFYSSEFKSNNMLNVYNLFLNSKKSNNYLFENKTFWKQENLNYIILAELNSLNSDLVTNKSTNNTENLN